MTIITIVTGAFSSHKRIMKETGGHGHKRTSRDHPKYNIIENGQKTEKSLGD